MAARSQPGCLELAFYDISRDYQPGLQRARRSAAATSAQQSVAAALSPVEAKALAVDRLHAVQAGRLRRSLRLPWRHIGLSPGSLVALAGESTVWRVREARFENFIVHLDLERSSSAAPRLVPLADGGRALARWPSRRAGWSCTSSICRPSMALFRRCRGNGLRARGPPPAGGAPPCS